MNAEMPGEKRLDLAGRVFPAQRPTIIRAPRPLRWRRVGRALGEAWQGLASAWRTEPNLRLHAAVCALVAAGGVWLRFSQHEWLALTLAMGLVIVAELINTVIERTVDLVVGLAPDPLARQIKDLAAGSVLVATLIATVVGLLVLAPRLF
jgi:undecaprenol kinase